MNTAETLTAEVCGTVLLLGTGAFVIARKAVGDLLFALHRALAEGWVEASGTVRVLPLAKRTPPAPRDSAEAAADPAPAAASAASNGPVRSVA